MSRKSENCSSFFFSQDFFELSGVCDEVDKTELYSSFYDEEMYNTCVLVEQMIIHQQQTFQSPKSPGIVKRRRESKGSTKKQKIEESLTSMKFSENNRVLCHSCHQSIGRRSLPTPLKTNKHKINTQFTHISVSESAFGQRHIKFKIDSRSEPADLTFSSPAIFLNSIYDEILYLTEKCIQDHVIFEVKFVLQVEYAHECRTDLSSVFFQSSSFVVLEGDDLDVFFSTVCESLGNEVHVHERKCGKSSFKKIKGLEMNVVTSVQNLVSKSWNIIM